MKRLLNQILPLLLIASIGPGAAAAVSIPANAFQIVESVPSETILGSTDIPRTADVWLDMINGAEKSLDIEVFYIAASSGSRMEEVLNAVKSACLRGVKTRVLVDSVFYKKEHSGTDELKAVHGLELRVIPVSALTGGIMHAKFFIADGREVFAGSQNFDWRALEHIHEIGARINDSGLANAFLEIFNRDWEIAVSSETGKMRMRADKNSVTDKNPLLLDTADYGKLEIYPAFSPPSLTPAGLNLEEQELIKLIDGANDELLIQVMTFMPEEKKKGAVWNTIKQALAMAGRRGVKTKLLLSDWALKKNALKALKKLSSLNGMELRIITIPRHSSGFIPYSRVDHSKYMAVDGKIAWISTSNWERGYFQESRDAALIIKGGNAAEKLSEIFYRSWNSPYSEEFDPQKHTKPAWKQRPQ